MKSRSNKKVAVIKEEFGVSDATVSRWISSGFLSYGEHYIDLALPTSQKPNYRFNLEKIKELFLVPPANRK